MVICSTLSNTVLLTTGVGEYLMIHTVFSSVMVDVIVSVE